MFRWMDSFYQFFITAAVPGIKTVITGHFVMRLRYMLDQQRNKVQNRNGFLHEGIILVPVVMESDIFTVIRINTVQSNNWAPQVFAARCSESQGGIN